MIYAIAITALGASGVLWFGNRYEAGMLFVLAVAGAAGVALAWGI